MGAIGDAEEIGFEGDDAVLAPGEVGEGLDQVFLGGAEGLVFVAEGFEMGVVEVTVLGGHDQELFGVEGVAHGADEGSRNGGFWCRGHIFSE